MGYTHYYSLDKRPSVVRWRRFQIEVGKILAHPSVASLVCFESDEPDRAPWNRGSNLRFNGKGEQGHETFFLERAALRLFCKTGGMGQADLVDQWGKSYDLAVCAVLISGHEHLGLEVHSDGEWHELGWLRARTLYGQVTNRITLCPWPQKTCAKCKLGFKQVGHAWGGYGKADKSLCYMCSNGFETKEDARAELSRQLREQLARLAAQLERTDVT